MGNSQLFVIRIWQQPGPFRASVRRVEGETSLVFHAAAELVAYLQTETSPSGDQGEDHGPEDTSRDGR